MATTRGCFASSHRRCHFSSSYLRCVLWMQRHGGVDLRLLFREGDGGFGVFEIAADVHDSVERARTRQYLVINRREAGSMTWQWVSMR